MSAPAHLESLLARLDLEQKVRLVSGAGMWSTGAVPEIGLRPLVFSDGPSGVRGGSWDERDPSTSLPSPTALAATWDEGLAHRYAGVLADEARRKGVHAVLGPTVNLHRSPLGGRHFEAFSEDPLLTARLARSYVRGLQDRGVAATPKHFVANDSETDRFTVDVRVDERTLRELYLAPFEAAVEAGAWLVMSSYNRVNGTTMTENVLLRDPLKSEWGFDGVVVSDWTGVRSTGAAAGANDLAMPGPSRVWGEPLLSAVREGTVPEAAVDEKVRRLLALAERVGALGGSDDGAAAENAEPGNAEPWQDGRAVAREVAVAGSVLLRNEPPLSREFPASGQPLLPLDGAALNTVAVIGPNAADARVQGGGSAEVVPDRVISPLEGLRAALEPEVEIRYATGAPLRSGPAAMPTALTRDPSTEDSGVAVAFHDADGAVVRTEHRRTTRLVWMGDEQLDGVHRIEARTRFRADRTGTHRIGVAGVGRYALTAGGTTLVDEVIAPEGDDPAAAFLAPPQRSGELELTAGQEVELVAIHDIAHSLLAMLRLDVEQPGLPPEQEIERAAALAAESDVAVVVVGTTPEVESEGYDRRTLRLPGQQDRLVRAVARANPATAVVVNAGSPVELPWREEVAATLLTWFPGQECGHALADVLLGTREPGGRLPTTWGGDTASTPVLNTTPSEGALHYAEGLHVGHRAWARSDAEPAYPFGFGLGYTGWRYESLPEIARGEDGVTVRVRLTNTGRRAGSEVVQVYLARPESSIERPVRWLAGHARAEAAAGETTEVAIPLHARAFQHWSTDDQRWAVEPGAFTVLAGGCSRDLPLSGAVEVS